MATFTGTAGNDIANANDQFIGFTGGTEEEFLDSIGDTFRGLGGNDQIVTQEGNDILDGGAGNDTLVGNDGNDRLIGGTGNDTMAGAAGDDLYEVDNLGDALIELSGGGHDTVRSTVDRTLGGNFEDLYLVGSAANGTGNTQDNRLEGNAAANTLSGLDGNDLLSGQGGDDILLGGAGNDRLIGAAGNDTHDGGTGNDVMQGGAGDDTYVVDSFSDQVSEGASQGTDSVQASLTYFLANNVENLTLTGSGNIGAVGNSLANVIEGNSGNNGLLGEGGDDTLTGGDGNDELNGGPGGDFLQGDGGDDFYSWFNAAEGDDTILGFVSAEDTLAFSAAGFGGGLTSGETLVDGTTFIVGGVSANPTTAEGTFLYEGVFGDLYWDVDGTGPNPKVLIAYFEDAPTLTSADFLIV
jgi:Ca2+-binding RTX toxin-like protein